MIGMIGHYDDKTKDGYIIGRDRKRYDFSRADYRNNQEPETGRTVDFTAAGPRAREIILMGSASSNL
jgi:hypothetical protein